VLCKRDGIVDQVDSERIIVRVESDHSGVLSREVGADIYTLIKFKRSNQNTCINQKPLVRVGDRVKKGQVLADVLAPTGELALGRNVLVAFVPWRGYNFEDAILVSESWSRTITTLRFTSRSTKSKRAIPSSVRKSHARHSEHQRIVLRNLDESGVIRIGAVVKPGDISSAKSRPRAKPR